MLQTTYAGGAYLEQVARGRGNQSHMAPVGERTILRRAETDGSPNRIILLAQCVPRISTRSPGRGWGTAVPGPQRTLFAATS